MGRIDKATVERILDATNIVDVVGDFVSLKKRGSSYLGLCPFHNERTPSFSVSGSRGIFKCFSCGKAGTAVSFLMDLEKMTYVEAIKWLGKKYGIDVKERELTSVEKEEEAERESMFAANQFALKHFETTLTETEDGRNIGLSYFRERGINESMIKKFHLGYALERKDDLLNKAIAAGFKEKYLVDTGLCIKTDDGRVYDRFKGRVIYPVHSLSGRVVAFGGRTLSKEKTVAKYVNSPESSIYSKSKELYGIYQARNAIAKKKNCILVEGYMDVISMHQAGVENVVSSSGTSLTDGQIRMIKRFADEVTLIYDSDPAGIKAALRGINMLVAAGLSLRLVLLPEGEDPDSFAQSHSASEVEQYIADNSQDLIGFKVDILMKESGKDPRKRTEAINDILETIALIPDYVEQSIYVENCASQVGVSASVLGLQLKKIIAKNREHQYNQRQQEIAAESIIEITEPKPAEQPVAEKKVAQPVYQAEEELIRYVLRYGMLYMCDVYLEDKTKSPMSVVDYIEYEMGRDGLSFSVENFKAVWLLALQIRDQQWKTQVLANNEILSRKSSAELAAGQEELRVQGLDSATIKQLEQKLKERVEQEFKEAADRFARSFIRERMLRSEDRSLTDFIASLSSDNVVLSKMYPKVDARKDVCEKLPLAVNTLRSVLLKERINNLCERLSTIPREDIATINSVLEQIRELKQLSIEFDKFNGELVIKPTTIR